PAASSRRVADRERLRRDALQSLIDKKLVSQKVREAGIKISDEEIKQAVDEVRRQNGGMTQEALVSALAAQGMSFDTYRAQIREQLERVRLVGQEVRAKVQVTAEEVARYYQANPKEFGTEEKVRARHIFFRAPRTSEAESRAAARAKAEETVAELRKGVDFATLAAARSDDPSGKEGGSLGLVAPGDMLPEVQQALAELKPGEVSGVVETAAGFHVVRLDERVPAQMKRLEEVRDAIEEKLYRGRMDERFQQWLDDLKKGAVIEVMNRQQ
ncbi:MAG TPA: peptidylprolyl isomerase, partial [Verrucomicrobiae bacterium]|nr:peptidylprolyl isomerase [Verrucomicrobiae bacterium]